MTVKCIDEHTQLQVCHMFRHENSTITDLSYEFKVSRRTIIRVLEQHGIDPQIKSRNASGTADPAQIPPQLPMVLCLPRPIPTKTPWYRRIKNWLFGLYPFSSGKEPQYQ